MSWSSPEEAYQAVKSRARQVRRMVWHLLWQAPAAIAYGMLVKAGQVEGVMRVAPYGPAWLRDDMPYPDTTFAFTKDGNVLKALDRVTDEFVPGTISPDKIVNEYVRAKTRYLLSQSKLTAMICDNVIGEAQECITIDIPYGEWRSGQLAFSLDNIMYLDYPQGYEPVTENNQIQVSLAGSIAAVSLTPETGMPQWWCSEEQCYVNIVVVRGRLSLLARDQAGNQGYIADLGIMVSIRNMTDIPVYVRLPLVYDGTVWVGESVTVVLTNSWSMMAREAVEYAT